MLIFSTRTLATTLSIKKYSTIARAIVWRVSSKNVNHPGRVFGGWVGSMYSSERKSSNCCLQNL
jgi:hypothetical protein